MDQNKNSHLGLRYVGILFLLITAQHVFAQNSDPRQYLTITETNKQTNKTRVIFESDSTNSRLIGVVDVNSIIEINFKKSDIISNTQFAGNISLFATISQRNIEVSPYSQVGKTKKSYGIQTKSADEIISNFHSLMIQCNQLRNEGISRINDDLTIEDKYVVAQLKILISYYSKLPTDNIFPIWETQHEDKHDILFELLGELNDPSDLTSYLNQPDKFDNKAVLRILGSSMESERGSRAIEIAYHKMLMDIELFNEYLEYFQLSGQQTEAALLSMLNLNKVFLNNLNDGLTQAALDLKRVLSNPDSLSFNNTFYTNQKLVELKTPLNQLLGAYGYLYKESRAFVDSGEINLLNISESVEYEDAGSRGLNRVHKEMAKEVSKLIYSKLLNASIDLKESGAKQGEVLKLFIRFGGEDSDSTEGELELPIGVYEIDEIGWRLKISDSFLLIDRDVEPTNDSTLSPSQFKGAPGVSMVWSYGNARYIWWNDFKWLQRTINWLEPSVGVNVSYVDFHTTQDVEIGAGIIGGLFRNRLLFSVGYNLNADFNEVYYGVGFSFLNLAGKLGKE